MKAFAGEIYYHVRIHQAFPNLPWVLFLHGFMGRSEDFEPLTDALCDVCNPLTLDLAGHGLSDSLPRLEYPDYLNHPDHPDYPDHPVSPRLSEHSDHPKPPESYSIGHQARNLISVVERLQMDPLVLYGYSMGGRIALEAAIQRPELFRGLILESSSAGLSGNAEREKRRTIDRKRAEEIRRSFPTFLQSWVELPLFGPMTPSERETMIHHLGQSNPEAMADIIEAASPGLAPSRMIECASLHLPVLLITGEQDEKYRAIHSKLHETFPISERVVIPGAGHRVHRQQPKALIEPISSYLSEININPKRNINPNPTE